MEYECFNKLEGNYINQNTYNTATKLAADEHLRSLPLDLICSVSKMHML